MRRLALASSCLLLLKGLPALLQLLGLAGSPALPQLLGHALTDYLTGPHTGCPDAPEMMCGARLCSIVGKHHVGWSVPSLPGNYYIPTACERAALRDSERKPCIHQPLRQQLSALCVGSVRALAALRRVGVAMLSDMACML